MLLDFETVLYGRRWYDWEQWFGAMKLRRIKTAGLMRLSHYDQAVQAALEGSGVAIGKTPHLTRHLVEGRLLAPFGADGEVELGSFCLVFARGSAAGSHVEEFVAWLRDEVERDRQPARATDAARGRRRAAPTRSPARKVAVRA